MKTHTTPFYVEKPLKSDKFCRSEYFTEKNAWNTIYNEKLSNLIDSIIFNISAMKTYRTPFHVEKPLKSNEFYDC